MRLLLLLSALLTALTGTGSPAYAATVPAHQSAVVVVEAGLAQAQARSGGRPDQELPLLASLQDAGTVVADFSVSRPRLTERMRV